MIQADAKKLLFFHFFFLVQNRFIEISSRGNLFDKIRIIQFYFIEFIEKLSNHIFMEAHWLNKANLECEINTSVLAKANTWKISYQAFFIKNVMESFNFNL